MTQQELDRLARSYIDDVLAIHKAAGEPFEVSKKTYDAAVKGAEKALRDLCQVRERKVVQVAP
jgi:hypothetical protein